MCISELRLENTTKKEHASLSSFGWKGSLSSEQRHKALNKAVNNLGVQTTLVKLMSIQPLGYIVRNQQDVYVLKILHTLKRIIKNKIYIVQQQQHDSFVPCKFELSQTTEFSGFLFSPHSCRSRRSCASALC